MSKEILSLILCHELGHFLGGPPFALNSHWSSAEGQADDFAARICMKRLYYGSEYIQSNNGFKEQMTIALDLIKILAELRGDNSENYNLTTADISIAEKTILTHPSLSCRLEGFRQAYLNQQRPKCWFNPIQSISF